MMSHALNVYSFHSNIILERHQLIVVGVYESEG